MDNKICTHKDQIKDFPPQDITVCKECLELGDEWVFLRQCLTCGHVGCCDSSKNKHATKHFKTTNHPIMKNLSVDEDGGEWEYCYIDDMMIE